MARNGTLESGCNSAELCRILQNAIADRSVAFGLDGARSWYRSVLADTVVGFLLAGVGNVDIRRKTNYLIVDAKTTVKQIEDAFKEFTTREDIAIVMISQYVANMIRFLVDSYNKPVPAILEIPSKDHPYDPAHDSVLSRVKYLFNTESVASGRR
ncbi:hypothetical protein LR48_Vigan107s004100 [Vigna angularis]|uniref:V-type proton ATPase subunit F n=1 Tax=Phaseolus angularis TaxID=3914 RepID=A0A0L9T4L8_PHAAN|nr:hypothetical protein LR48_Vigan107s004100 [Vigna angularis]